MLGKILRKNNILVRNFDVFSHSEKNISGFKSFIFQSVLKGKLDFQKLSDDRIKKPLNFLIKEQKQQLKKEGIIFEEQPDSIFPMVKLESICEIVIGRTPKRNHPEYFGGNNTWVSIKDMNQKIISKTKECITDAGVKASNSKKIKTGTILLSFKLSIGKVSIADKDLYTNEAIAGLPIKNKQTIFNTFLFNQLCNLDFTKIQSKKVVKGNTLNKKSCSGNLK